MQLKNIILTIAVFIILILIIQRNVISKGGEEETTYVLFSVDTERDLPPFHDTFTGMDDGLPILCDLFDKHDVKATFFVTGHTALNRPEAVADLAIKHEVGCHGLNHVKNLSELEYDEKRYIIEESTRILSSLLGKGITSFRAPCHSIDQEIYDILDEMGYLVESSAYVGPNTPYHPSEEDWTKQGDMEILHVPVTRNMYYFYPMNLYPRPWISFYDDALRSQEGNKFKLIVIGIHPWELIEQDFFPIFIADERPCGEYTYHQLSSLLDYLDDKNVTYITMSEAYEIFS